MVNTPSRGNALVRIDTVKKAIAKKYDDRIPDHVWNILQECGEEAANHLHRILKSPGFEKRKIHEQIRVIELAMLRSYGSPEAALKRPAPTTEQDTPERKRLGNALADLAEKAKLPELQPRKKL